VGSTPSYADWRRNQAAVTVATFVGFTGFTLVMPFLPLYFEELGVHDPADIAIWSGVSLGVTPAITACMAPAWARVADRYGRKVMVARSLAAFVVIMALMAVVAHPWQVLALRGVLGFFAGYGPMAMTMAAESAPPEMMATAIGWVQTAQRLGPALGPAIGGTLALAVGLRQAFLIAALVYVLAFLLVVFGYREIAGAERPVRATGSRAATFASLRRVPQFVLFMGGVFGLQLVDRSFGPILPLYLGEIGAPTARIPVWSGVLFTVTAGVAAVGNHLTSRLMDRTRVSAVVPLACAIAAMGAAVFVVGPSMRGLVAAAAVFGLGMGVATTTIYTAASRAVDPGSRGVAFGYLSMAYLAGLAVSPVAAGLVGSLSIRAVFVVDVVALLGMAALIWRALRDEGDEAEA
jgi:DHA1 family multidrug resistance protein-like MFS transporter